MRGHLDVLLISEAPQRQRTGLSALRARGLRVTTATNSPRACVLLARQPGIVLADLGSHALFTPALVKQLNAVRGRCLVIALHHQGVLNDTPGELTRLVVDGFAPAHGWPPHLFAELARNIPASAVLH